MIGVGTRVPHTVKLLAAAVEVARILSRIGHLGHGSPIDAQCRQTHAAGGVVQHVQIPEPTALVRDVCGVGARAGDGKPQRIVEAFILRRVAFVGANPH